MVFIDAFHHLILAVHKLRGEREHHKVSLGPRTITQKMVKEGPLKLTVLKIVFYWSKIVYGYI